MRRLISCLVVVGVIACAPSLLAKASFAGPDEMVRRSVAIAIIEISRVEKVEAKGASWTYSERASATVEQTLKGSLPKQIHLFGGENFICAQNRFQPGRYLVFLKQDGDKLTGANWYLSARPIKGEQVEWYAVPQRYGMSWHPLSEVLGQVNVLLEQRK